MVNATFRSWVLAGWVGAVSIIAVASAAMGVSRSTTVLLVALGVAFGIVVVLLTQHAPKPTVAEILHSVGTKDGRS